jgi:hypothetical protein
MKSIIQLELEIGAKKGEIDKEIIAKSFIRGRNGTKREE